MVLIFKEICSIINKIIVIPLSIHISIIIRYITMDREGNNMKKFVKIMSLVLMLFVVISISACAEPADTAAKTGGSSFNAADLVGKWKGTGDEISTLTFGKDGKYKDDAGIAVVEGTYTVDEEAGTLTVNEKEYGLVFVYSVELSGKNLTIQTDYGVPRTFTKK